MFPTNVKDTTLTLHRHVHWYERLNPLGQNGAIDYASIIKNSTDNGIYKTNPGNSMVHLINGAAGNIESHSTLDGQPLPMTVTINKKDFGFSMLTVHNATTLSWKFIKGEDGSTADALTVLKDASSSCNSFSSTRSSCSSECSGPSSSWTLWIYCQMYCSSFWDTLKH